MVKTETKILDWIRKQRLIGILGKKSARLLFSFLYRIRWAFVKIDENQVLFCSYMGRDYSCSPRSIYEALLKDKQYQDFKFIWVFKQSNIQRYQNLLNNRNTSIVALESKEFERAFASSKYSFVNSRLPINFWVNKKQVAVQCWHGTPLKKLGFDIEKGDFSLFSTAELRYSYEITVKQMTYFLSPSKFASEKFSSAFNLQKMKREDAILELGYPRNDYLFNFQNEDVKRIKKNLGIPENKKVCLYAPTWRDNQHVSGEGYILDIPLDFVLLQEKIAKDYVLIYRPHHFIASRFDFEKHRGFVFNGTEVEDINDLYIISDILITDYSSVFFDYANLKRPMIFYMYDLLEYKDKLRDFYLELSELPGDIVEKQEELTKAILNAKPSLKMLEFRKKYNYLDDGKAAERVISQVMKN